MNNSQSGALCEEPGSDTCGSVGAMGERRRRTIAPPRRREHEGAPIDGGQPVRPYFVGHLQRLDVYDEDWHRRLTDTAPCMPVVTEPERGRGWVDEGAGELTPCGSLPRRTAALATAAGRTDSGLPVRFRPPGAAMSLGSPLPWQQASRRGRRGAVAIGIGRRATRFQYSRRSGWVRSGSTVSGSSTKTLTISVGRRVPARSPVPVT